MTEINVINTSGAKTSKKWRSVAAQIGRRKARGYFNVLVDRRDMTPLIFLQYAADLRYSVTPGLRYVEISWA